MIVQDNRNLAGWASVAIVTGMDGYSQMQSQTLNSSLLGMPCI